MRYPPAGASLFYPGAASKRQTQEYLHNDVLVKIFFMDDFYSEEELGKVCLGLPALEGLGALSFLHSLRRAA
jgi:hypothetical protein